MAYQKPSRHSPAFTCPHCGAYAQQSDGPRFIQVETSSTIPAFRGRTKKCQHCRDYTVFLDDIMVFPVRGLAPPPAEDMPDAVKRLYEEAAAVSAASPRAASALLRTAVEILVTNELGGDGKLFDAIGQLVADGRIAPKVSKAMDVVRVTGNGAVHPGQIDPDDNQEMATALFSLLNLIVESAITEEARLDAMFDQLPEGAREAIARRDGVGETE